MAPHIHRIWRKEKIQSGQGSASAVFYMLSCKHTTKRHRLTGQFKLFCHLIQCDRNMPMLGAVSYKLKKKKLW